jgi:diguanylate cyclase (GGDEF)-like protein
LLRPVAELLPERLGAVAVVPLVAGDRCLGVILAQSVAPRTMAARDVATARVDGRLTATLLDLQFGPDLENNLGAPRGAPAFAAALHAATVSSGAPASPARLIAVDRRRIFLVEDDEDNATTLAGVLTDEGFDVVRAADGEEALRRVKRARPDLILLDVNIPLLDGFSVASELSRDPATSAIPILFLSGVEDLVPRVRGLDLDGVDFMRKPYSLLELLARIDRSLNQARSKTHLRQEANIDHLTGLGNLRRLREHLEVEQSRIGRYGSSMAVVMVDVDKLKEINDRHGHPAGSRILKAIAQTFQSEIRETDLAVRYGGDEFVILLPHATMVEGAGLAERLLSRIRELRPEGIDISVSLGVSVLESAGRTAAEAVLAQADAAAYRAKHGGGGRVCTYDAAVDGPGPGVWAPLREVSSSA